ncbi:MAG: RDD family protein, partial [Burkholderiaceae bacterium]
MQSNETNGLAKVSHAIDAGDLEYAGFWIRVGAALIDSILLLLIITPLLVKFYGWTYFSASTGSNAYVFVKGPSDFIISYLIPAIISIAFWMTKGATPGKMLL